VIFKPSEVAPRAGELVESLFDGLLPPGVFQVLQGGPDLGAALVAADVDHVVFTGGVKAGRAVAHACAERLAPCSLELGGKDAAIVLADANLDRAARGIAWGALTMSGQNCASVERVYVEERVATAFKEKLVSVVRALGSGDVGPLATDAQARVVAGQLADAEAAGARVLLGGVPSGSDAGRKVPPTVLAVDSDDLAVMRDETFGPVIPVAVVQSPEEAVRRANASRYGLTASVWTRRLAVAEKLAHQLRAGVVTINNHAFTGALPAAPWSGMGDSGSGITNSPLALDALTRPRFVLVDRNRATRELWWYPYTPALRTIALAFAVLRSRTPSPIAKLRALVRLVAALPKRLLGG
jgi:acyl-CoA reductase-like NAD-dependent aldehyde dehydrogenase